MSHSCYPNAWHFKDDNLGQVVRAVRPIQSGEEITICYLDADVLFKSAVIRNQGLTMMKLFVCTCERCRLDNCRMFKCIKCENDVACNWNGNGWPFKNEEILLTCTTCNYVFTENERDDVLEKENALVSECQQLPRNVTKLRDSRANPSKAIDMINQSITNATKILSKQHWVIQQHHIMVKDFYEHVIKDLDKVVELNQQILMFSERAYPGPYFFKAIYTENLADAMKIYPENYPEVKRLYDLAKITLTLYYGEKNPYGDRIASKQEHFMVLTKKCGSASCDNTSDKKCSRCHKIGYCSKECQLTDWKRHKLLCK